MPEDRLPPEAEAFMQQWGQSVPYGLRQLVRRDLAALLAAARAEERERAAHLVMATPVKHYGLAPVHVRRALADAILPEGVKEP